MRGFQVVTGVIGLAAFLYYVIMVCYAGPRTAFWWFWLGLGAGGQGLFALTTALMTRGKAFPRWFLYGSAGIFGATLVVLVILLTLILSAEWKKTPDDVDYVVVLGAQVRGERPTKSLRLRAAAAAAYLEEHPETKVIASGGQGRGESISEAEAIRRLLTGAGIQEDRILLEDRSTTTVENLKFSYALLQKEKSGESRSAGELHLAVATNGFHVYRAVKLAKAQGFTDVSGIAAPSDPILIVSYYIRECLAILKEWVVGNF